MKPKNALFTLARLFVYSAVFLFFTFIIIWSMILETLPDNNVFGLNTYRTELIKHSLALVLTFNASVIIPKLVDNIHAACSLCIALRDSIFVSKYRPLIILFLRTMSTLIIPFVSAVLLLDECGNNWTYFWNDCYHNTEQFDISYHIYYLGKDIQVMSSSEICSPTSFGSIPWNKCLRSFTAMWSTVITQKLCIMMVMPFIMVHIKKLKRKIKDSFCKEDDPAITIDMEYAMMLTKFESMIIWCPISPFVIPLTLISTQLNYFFYHKRIMEKDWMIKPFNNSVVMPVYSLWLSIIVSQCFITLFVIVSIENEACGYVLAAAFLTMDIVCGIQLYNAKKQEKVGKRFTVELDEF